jgi:hypothetical protein
MALLTWDLKDETAQVKNMVGEIVDEKISPMLRTAINQAGDELGIVILKASNELQNNIKTLSEEIHDQRRLTKEDIVALIDYAAEKIGKTIDARVEAAKQEASVLITEKTTDIFEKFENAALQSRKTLWANIAISTTAALVMAIIGIIYRKITLGELDIFWLFRVLLLSGATGTGLFAFLKFITAWRRMSKSKKDVFTVAIDYVSPLRPNGTSGLFILSIILFFAWLYLFL